MHAGDTLGVTIQQLLEAEQDACPAQRRVMRPAGKRARGTGNCAIDFSLRRRGSPRAARVRARGCRPARCGQRRPPPCRRSNGQSWPCAVTGLCSADAFMPSLVVNRPRSRAAYAAGSRSWRAPHPRCNERRRQPDDVAHQAQQYALIQRRARTHAGRARPAGRGIGSSSTAAARPRLRMSATCGSSRSVCTASSSTPASCAARSIQALVRHRIQRGVAAATASGWPE